MIEIGKAYVFGFEYALKGMRNPMDSWDKGDSHWVGSEEESTFAIGKNDLELCKKLIKAGSSHRKFLRMIHVQMDVKAPLYWWKEFETYKVGTVSNSCSTMHRIHTKEFTLDDFSTEHIGIVPNCDPIYYGGLEGVLISLNEARNCYLDTKDKDYWWQMIQLLPSSYNQLRTLDTNYETLLNMYRQRKNHKLDEWREFCDWIDGLPYMKEFMEVD